MSNFHTTLFKIVLYWCLDPICHNIGTHLKLNKYIFDISIPFCHHLYPSAILKQCFTEFVVCRTAFHHVDMSVRGRIPTCDLIGRLFLGSGLQRMCLLLVKWLFHYIPEDCRKNCHYSHDIIFVIWCCIIY